MFKLLRYFSITSFIAFTVVAVLLGILYRQIVLGNLHDIAENKNVALTQAFSNSLWPEFAPFVEDASALPPEELKDHPEIARLHQAVLDQMEGLSVVKVKVYDLNGLTVFSTEARQIGEDKSNDAGYLAARSGQVASELAHRDAFSAFEGEIADRDVFSSYVPIQPGGPTESIVGVFEVYDDVTPLIERIEHTQRNIIGGTIFILGALYGVLFFIVRHANRVIQRQYHDLTKSTTALQASEERFRQVIASISHHIYVTEVTGDGTLVNRYISPNVEILSGYPLEKIANDWSFWPSTIIHPDDRQAAADQAERLAAGQSSEIEYRLIRADGETIWVRDSGRVKKDVSRHSLMVYGVVSDITEQRQAKEALIWARDQALEASHLKTELLAKVSHELRTPLGAILGFAEMMDLGIYGPISSRQQQATAQIIDSTNYLTKLVDELLDQAQLDVGKLKLDISSFAPADIFDGMLARMRVLAQVKGLTLTTAIATDIPATLSGDPVRVQQILVNLVGNAIKFTRQGTVQVQLYRPNTTHWAMAVSDTGPGIPVEAQPQIFEPFRQVDSSVTREHRGTGLGLSIVKQLTTLMGGQITLESEVGRGSTFTVVLPLKPRKEKML